MEFSEEKSHTITNELRDIDERICSCVNEIQLFLDSIGDSDKSVINRDGATLISSLNQLLLQFHEHQGLEEYFLPHLSEFRRQNSFSLFRTLSVSCCCDNDLIDMFPNDEENTLNFRQTPVKTIWENICYHIEQYIVHQLMLLRPSYTTPLCDINKFILCNYLRSLCNIVVPYRVWEVHKRIRKYHLLKYLCSCNQNAQEEIQCFSCLLKLCVQYIAEDHELICLGHFHPLVITWTDLIKVYIDVVSEKFLHLLNLFDKWLQCPHVMDTLLHCLLNKNSSCHLHSVHNSCWKHWKCGKNPIFLDIFEMIESDSSSNYKDFNGSCCNIKRNSRQTRDIVMNLIEILDTFEKHVLFICGRKLSEEMDEFSRHKSEEDSLTAFSFTIPDDSPEQSPIHEAARNSYSQDDSFSAFPWDWKILLANCDVLTTLQQILQDRVQTMVKFHTRKEWEAFSSTGVLPDISKESDTVNKNGNTYLRFIMTSVFHVVKEIETFFPLLLSSQGALTQFKASFSHALNTYLVDLVKHIANVATSIPQKASIYSLYTVLNSAVFLRDRLHVYSNLLSKDTDEMESPIFVLYVKAMHLVQNIMSSVLSYHLKHIRCVILQDAESHNWKHHKPFYEGERISYSIQMWYLYLCGLHHDTMRQLPPHLAQEIYINILHDSLSHLVARYSGAMPSDVRTPQLRADIVAILLYMGELLPPACSSLGHLLGKVKGLAIDKCTSLIQTIHSHCCSLLLVLAVVTSPLNILYKTFKKGFPVYSLSSEQSSTSNVAPWLTWMFPTMYPQSRRNMLMSNISVWLLVRLCSSWTCPNAVLVLQAFTSHECTLAILFLTQASQIQSDDKELKLNLARALLQAVTYCHHQPQSLVNVLTPVIHRLDGWKEFDKSKIAFKPSERPWWYQAFMELFDPLINRIVNAIIPSLIGRIKQNLSVESSEAWKQVKNEMNNFLLCSCDPSVNKSASNKSYVIGLCFTDLMASLARHVMTLSPCLHTLLASLDHQLSTSGSDAEPLHESLILQVLLSGIHNCLRGQSFVIETSEESSKNELVKDTCSSLADLLIQDFPSDDAVQSEELKDAFKTVKTYVMQIKNYFQSWVLPHQKYTALSKDCCEKIEDDNVYISATELSSQSIGKDIIEYLHKLIFINVSWIKSSLGIPAVFSTDVVLNTISPSPTPYINPVGTVIDTSALPSSQSQIRSPEEQKVTSSLITAGTVNGVENPGFDQPEESSSARETPVCKEEACKQHLDIMLSQLHQSNVEHSAIKRGPQLTLDVHQAYSLFNETFNPLKVFNTIGDNKLDQKLLADFPFSWDSLLLHTPQLGLTEVGFQTLLSHRWEFKGNGRVSQEQEKYLQVLKSQYECYENSNQS